MSYSESNKRCCFIQAGTGIAEIIALEVSKQVSFFTHWYYVNVCQDWASTSKSGWCKFLKSLDWPPVIISIGRIQLMFKPLTKQAMKLPILRGGLFDTVSSNQEVCDEKNLIKIAWNET